MTSLDVQLEQFYKSIGDRPPRKNEETLTHFDRAIYWYDKDELSRQADRASANTYTKITYEDHRKSVETAVNIMRKSTQHEIAMCILTHRFFKDYRAKVFAGEGSFVTDYSFLISKIAMLFNPTTNTIKRVSIASKLKEYTTPTLVQINHISGDVSSVNVPSCKTLNEWASALNQGAPESTSYRLAGLKIA